MRYRPEIDGLRAVSVLSVFVYHADAQLLPGGFVGVDVFFVISGFLIGSIVLNEVADGRFSIVSFYERRARRILPALFFVLAVSGVFAFAWLTPSELRSFSADAVAAVLFGSNVKFWLTEDYFSLGAEHNPLIHTWSLGLEEQFYIVFPLIVMAAAGMSRRRLGLLLAALALASLVAAELTVRPYPSAAFYLLPFRGFELLIGVFGALAVRGAPHPPGGRMTAEVASAAGLAAILASCFAFDAGTPFPGAPALLPTVGALAVILFARPETVTGRLLGSRPFVALGLISYSAYLWHQPLFVFARLRLGAEADLAVMGLAALVALALAALTWRFVEQPFRRHGAISPARVFVGSSAVGAALVAAGLVGYLGGGLPGRLSAEALEVAEGFRTEAEARHREIRTGVCHYNTGRAGAIEAFLGQWDCAAAPGGVLVVGDSYAADRAAALRAVGRAVGQMTGAGCDLAPSLMSPDCRRLFDRASAHAAALDPRPVVLLANRFEPHELTEEKIDELIEYWRPVSPRVAVFTNMPVFPNLQNQAVRAAWLDGAAAGGSTVAHARPALMSEAESVRGRFDAAGFAVIETRALFCALTPDCGFVDDDGVLLLVDQDHLGPAGARRFGALLDGRLAELFPAEAAR